VKPLVVVGASLAGMSAAVAARSAGHDGPIVVLDPSPELPHDRPPLSKQVLAGSWELDAATQPVVRQLDDLDLDLRLGVAATSLDVAGRSLGLGTGGSLEADGIVIATGSHARHLPGDRPEGVHVVRTGADALALRAELESGPRVVVIGAGFIGAEVAATCRERGLDVVMVEAAEVPLPRALPGDVGMFIAHLHRDQGVDVRLGVGVDALVRGGDGRVAAVRMADGSEVAAEVVVVGVGAAPEVAWLEGSGLDLLPPERGGGIHCNSTLLAAPGIVAAGDVAAWPNPHFGGEVMRVEHWENAIDSGTHAGRRILAELGEEAGEGPVDPFASVPWFWSDQYGRKIQMVGRAAPGDEPVVVDGSLDDDRFVVLFRRGDRCRAALGVGRPRQVMQARMKMAESLEWGPVAGLFG
jgi:3-phenylpropionate/trans-cinnamate dioxygenase ferredoxin reductase subunit